MRFQIGELRQFQRNPSRARELPVHVGVHLVEGGQGMLAARAGEERKAGGKGIRVEGGRFNGEYLSLNIEKW